ncbi:YhgN family NAAT transporter [Vibrio gallicus]|uniref:YhgN family NAAT transporter n=1 Tax=Vibrio gallicus TaxID=190897 RepID=UPI0021C2BD2E|nr:YhgN family NAAT transporter [Vibrio gallicus]
MDTLSAAVMLFLIMDPMGNLPVFTSLLKHIEKKRRRIILIRELVIALCVMLIFLFAGETILNFLGLNKEAISISGAIILFLISLKMIFPPVGGLGASLGAGDEPLIVPLAIPLVAGPSIIATLILLAHQEPDRMGDWALALLGAWAASTVILMFSEVFQRVVGEKGLQAIERLMGMLLLMIAVQMFLNGIQSYLS